MSEKKLKRLVVALEAEVGKYQRDLEKAKNENEKFKNSVDKTGSKVSDAFKTMRNAVTAFAGAFAVGATFSKVFSATQKQQDAVKQLEATWKSTGNTMGFTVDEMVRQAGRLQDVSIFGDEDIIAGMSRLGTYANITGENFERATAAALDMSAKLGTDLASSFEAVGKAIDSPIRGMSSLSDKGFTFTQQQRDLITALVETGRVADAQRIILNELEFAYGGSAKAARETFSGALAGLNNAFGDLFEADSLGGVAPAIEELTKLLQSDETKAAAASLTNAMVAGFTNVIWTINKLAGVMRRLFGSDSDLTQSELFEKITKLNSDILDVQEKMLSVSGKRAEMTKINLAADLKKLEEERAALMALYKLNQAQVQENVITIGGGTQQEEPAPDEYGFLPGQDPFDAANQKDTKKIQIEYELNEIAKIRAAWRQQELQREYEFQAKMMDFMEASTVNKIKMAAGEVSELLMFAAGGNKKLAKIARDAGIIQATIATYQGIAKGVALGWPLAVPAVAWAALNGWAQVRKLQSMGDSGGISTSTTGISQNIPSVSVGQPVESPGTAETRGTTNFIINGDVFGMDDVEDKILNLIAHASDTNAIRITDTKGRTMIERT